MRNGKVTVTGVNKVFFTFTVIFIVAQFIFAALIPILGEDFLDRNMYQMLLVNEYIIILIPTLIYVLISGASFKETFRLNRLGILPAILIVFMSAAGYLAAAMVNTIVVYFLQFIGNVPNEPIPVPKNITELIIGILVVAVSPAICEEALHRGIIMRAYEKRGTFRAVVITAVFFGFFHFDITNFFGPVLLGLFIGYYVIRTNSIFAGALAHFTNNAIAELLQFYYRESQDTTKIITVSTEELISSVVLGIIGLILLLLLIKLFNFVTQNKAVINPPITSVKNDIVSVITHWPIVVVLIAYILLMGLYLATIVSGKIDTLQMWQIASIFIVHFLLLLSYIIAIIVIRIRRT